MTSEELLKALQAVGILNDDDVRDCHKELAAASGSMTDATPAATRLVKSGKLTKFQATQALGGKSKALVMGDYVLLDRIGAGGMGQVFKAQHRRMKRVVAIKLLPPAMLKDADSIKRFQREVEAAAKLMHTNIVTAFDAGQSGPSHYLVMEHVEGRDLSATVKDRGPLPVDEALRYVRQAATGLGYAHSKGVVHRDIKPANLLIDKEGCVKILDMGLARIDDGTATQEGLTQSGQVMGTVDYMAPEQAFDVKNVDARADIYSLGCTLYRLLVGENLYGGDSIMQKFLAHRESPIPDLQGKRPDVAPQLQAVFARMVAKKVEDRYQTMNEVVAALDTRGAASAAATDNASVTNDWRPGDWTTDSGTELFGNQKLKRIAELEPTLSGAHAEVSTDPKSQPHLPIDMRKPAGRRARGSKGPPWYTNRKTLLAAGGAGFLFVLLGVILVIKNHKGETVAEMNVPNGATAEVAIPPGGTAELKATAGGKVEIKPVETAAPAKIATIEIPQPVRPKPLVAPFDLEAARAGQAAWARYLNTPVERKISAGIPMVLIPPGEFMMGSTPEQIAAGRNMAADDKTDLAQLKNLEGEQPQHRVTLTRPFWLGQTEVTVGQFKKFVEATQYKTEAEQFGSGNSAATRPEDKVKPEEKGMTWRTPGYPVSDDLPVTEVTWNDAVQFCNWLSNEVQLEPCYQYNAKTGWSLSPTGNGYRLPTEAEWEYACRAGTTTQFSFGDDRDRLEIYAWIGKNAHGGPHEVGSKVPNAFGLFDMHGNAQEWCHDLDVPGYYAQSPPADPPGPTSGSYRVHRGGGWRYTTAYIRSAFHSSHQQVHRNYDIGFRVARVLDAPASSAPAATSSPGPAAAEGSKPAKAPASEPYIPWPLDPKDGREYTWSEPENLGPTVNNKGRNQSPTLTADQLCLIVNSGASGASDLVEFHRKSLDEPWGSGIRLTGSDGEIGPSLSADGLTLLYATNQAGHQGGRDIYMRRRAKRDAAWGPPQNLGPPINSAGDDFDAALSPDGLSLAFSSNRAGGRALDDLHVSRRPTLTAPWGTPQNLGRAVNYNGGDWRPQFLPDNKNLFFSRGTGLQITQTDAQGNLSLMKLPKHTMKYYYPWLSPDGRTLYFNSKEPPGGLGDDDIWVTRRVPKEGTGPGTLADLSRGLVGHWNFEAGQGAVAADSSGNKNDGKLEGLDAAKAWQNDAPPSPLAGSKSLEFDGKGGVIIPDAPSLSPRDALTVALWCKPAKGVSYGATRLVDKDYKKAFGVTLGGNNQPSPRFQAITGGAGRDIGGGKQGQLSTGDRWSHVVARYDGREMVLFVDGTRVAAKDASGPLGESKSALRLGREANNSVRFAFTGRLDDVRMYDRALGDAEIRVLAGKEAVGWAPPTTASKEKVGAAHPKKLAYLDPAFEKWVADTQKLPAEKQLEAVSKKLMELNPGFDGKLTDHLGKGSPKIEKGVVTELGFVADNVTDISPIRALAGLKALACGGTSAVKSKLSDLSPLEGMALTHLDCEHAQILDLSPLRGMPLVELWCGYGPVSDLSPLRGMPLRKLACQFSKVSDLSPLQGMPLTVLTCHKTLVSDLLPLRGMKLEYLSCDSTKVSDLSPLTGMPLTHLFCANCTVADLSPLRGLPLWRLNCFNTRVSDLSPLKDCLKLKTLGVGGTKVSAEGIAALQKALPDCKIEWDDPAHPKTAPQKAVSSAK